MKKSCLITECRGAFNLLCDILLLTIAVLSANYRLRQGSIQKTKLLLIHPNINMIKFSDYLPFKNFWDSLSEKYNSNFTMIYVYFLEVLPVWSSWTLRNLGLLLLDTCKWYNSCACVSLLLQWNNILHILNHVKNGSLHHLPPHEVLLTERLYRSVLWFSHCLAINLSLILVLYNISLQYLLSRFFFSFLNHILHFYS